MQFSRKSFSNLQALAQGDFGSSSNELQGGGPLWHGPDLKTGSHTSMDSDVEKRVKRWVAVLCIMIKGIQLVVFVKRSSVVRVCHRLRIKR